MSKVPAAIEAMPFRASIFRPLFRLRQVLYGGMLALVRDEEQLDRLFGRADHTPQGSDEGWAVEARNQIRAVFLDRRTPLRVELAYPMGDARLPVIALHVVSGRQELENQSMGGQWARQAIKTTHTDADGRQATRVYHEQAFPWSSTIQISTWAPAPELALLLHDLAIVALLAYQGRLRDAGVSELVDFSEQSPMQPDWKGAPDVPLVPLLQVGMRWRRHIAIPEEPVPSGVSSLGTTPTTSE